MMYLLSKRTPTTTVRNFLPWLVGGWRDVWIRKASGGYGRHTFLQEQPCADTGFTKLLPRGLRRDVLNGPTNFNVGEIQFEWGPDQPAAFRIPISRSGTLQMSCKFQGVHYIPDWNVLFIPSSAYYHCPWIRASNRWWWCFQAYYN